MADVQNTNDGAPSNDLTINDLNAMKVIIDIASSRGAFKPNEMVAVGQTYTKLTTFLDAVAAQQAAAEKAGAAQPAQATAQTTTDAVTSAVAGA
jgi:hypothetical protein